MCYSVCHMLRTVTNNSMSAKAFHERLKKRRKIKLQYVLQYVHNDGYHQRLKRALCPPRNGPSVDDKNTRTPYTVCHLLNSRMVLTALHQLRTVNSCVQGINEMTNPNHNRRINCTDLVKEFLSYETGMF